MLAAQALEGGASAFVLKQIDPRDLGGVLRQVVTGTVLQTVGGPGFALELTPGRGGRLDREGAGGPAGARAWAVEPADREGALGSPSRR